VTSSATAEILGSGTTASRASEITIDTVDLTTVEGAQSAINVIDGALAKIDRNRATLGAVQNRLNSTINNLSSVAENSSAARSRIRDTDFATETAELTRNQILQQAGTTILAQANQLPQAALSLLGG
jgi:flagellin